MTVSVNKRLRERSRQERQREKEMKRRERRDQQVTSAPLAPGVDPDIAHIVPGPQPVMEDM